MELCIEETKKLHVCGDENTEVQCCYLSINVVNVAMQSDWSVIYSGPYNYFAHARSARTLRPNRDTGYLRIVSVY